MAMAGHGHPFGHVLPRLAMAAMAMAICLAISGHGMAICLAMFYRAWPWPSFTEAL